VQALQETTIHARVNGYIRQRLIDIGDHVKAGQLLAEIESPEIEQELLQARASLGQSRANVQQVQANLKQVQATLQQARANMELAHATITRWRQLEQDQVVPRQQVDEKQAAFEAGQANVNAVRANVNAVEANVQAAQASVNVQEALVKAQEANVQRLTTLLSFRKITAPFDGVITSRTVEMGALITAGSTTASRELFRLAQIDTLRVYVNVPQTYVASIQPGQTAQVLVRELPQKAFAGKVVRTTSALDATSRTLPMEVQISNQDHTLLPGMYAQVKFSVSRATPPLLVPANALVLRTEGPQVSTWTEILV
jgi:multidrug efflux pump subunit AcrA (membrane-fusion protein)